MSLLTFYTPVLKEKRVPYTVLPFCVCWYPACLSVTKNSVIYFSATTCIYRRCLNSILTHYLFSHAVPWDIFLYPLDGKFLLKEEFHDSEQRCAKLTQWILLYILRLDATAVQWSEFCKIMRWIAQMARWTIDVRQCKRTCGARLIMRFIVRMPVRVRGGIYTFSARFRRSSVKISEKRTPSKNITKATTKIKSQL